MFALFFAAVTAAALPAAPAAGSIFEGCQPERLAPLLYQPPARAPELLSDLDRRIAATLAEERRESAELAQRRGGKGLIVALAIAGAALVVLVAGWRPGRAIALALALAGALLCLGAGASAWRRAAAQRDGAIRTRELVACRLRLLETRATLQHAQLARCIDDLGEAAEDIGGWVSRIRSGGTVGVEDMEHLHHEITRRP